MKRTALLAMLLVLLLLTASSCRTRTTGTSPADAGTGSAAGQSEGFGEASDGSAGTETAGSVDEPGGETREDPASDRREYDAAAAVEVEPGTDRILHGEGDGDGASVDAGDLRIVTRADENAGETATRTVADGESDRLAAADDAGQADSALQYYAVLLADRLGSLFECKRVFLYWETAEDHVTVYRTSDEHALILGAGVYDVSQRLLPENLRVDDGWIGRRDPDVIVKIVPADVLGFGVTADGAAAAVLTGLLARDGWSAVKAVRSGRVILLSEEMLGSPVLRTAAQVVIACTAYPELFADTDPAAAFRELVEEAVGSAPTGVCFLVGGPE